AMADVQRPSNQASARARLPRPVRERQMLEAATTVFAESGYHNTSMDQIADQVGISKPMIYAYFDSKEGLYRGCVEPSGTKVIDAVRASFDESYPPERALWEGFLTFFGFIRENPTDWELIRNESVKDVPALTGIIEQVHANLRALIGELSRIASKETPGDP